MIVLQSTHVKLQAEHFALRLQHEELLAKWNALVTKINAKGGEQFLRSESKQFDQGEIKKLIALCHPDKHAGSKVAEEITVKLLTMRK